MSVICQNFVQNAWKKELCSNCFKSKDEHNITSKKFKPLPATVINGNLSSIMKTGNNKKKSKRSVCFPHELSEIIGVGGEDWLTDDEESNDEQETNEEDFRIDAEDETDKELQRITKQNTDYNMSSLKDSIEVKKTYNNLMLGKPVVDSDGKKQTLLVTVTPFGEEPRKFNSIVKNPKQIITETKPNVVLTSYTAKSDESTKIAEKSLLEEINETLEQNKNSIQIISRKKVVNNKENVAKPVEKRVNLTRTPALKRDQEKPVIQTSSAKIELLNTKHLRKTQEVNNNNDDRVEIKEKPAIFPQSRELAGEPDGRADPPEATTELPALPLTPPPPMESQQTFLHSNPPEKPKIPSKPTVLVRKPILSTFQVESRPVLMKQDAIDNDLSRKRRAPKPPPEDTNKSHSIHIMNLLPEPAPRKAISLSTDNLNLSLNEKKPKNRFSLKKFLRMGHNTKELTKSALDLRPDFDSPPQPKPRIVIVHPSELTGAEIVPKSPQIEEKVTVKPPPPPRHEDSHKTKPIPPKSNEILQKQRQFQDNPPPQKHKETVYANIGEVRSSLVPNKPQRTASMREREEKQRKNNEIYDYINSSPEHSPKRLNKRSESSIDVCGDYFKENLPRTMSLTYCGSETESEIYAPYSFYGSESEVTEDEPDFWPTNGRTHKLRARKGRSIVHKNLEDNYGAVVVANHEALAQVLENVQQSSHVVAALRVLKTMENLRWSDFTLNHSHKPIVIGKCVFYQALWQMQHVTLYLSTGLCNSNTLQLGNWILTPITEFSDLIPAEFLSGVKEEENSQLIQANISVLSSLQIHTIQSYAELLHTKNETEMWREGNFVLLQFVNTLKTLQAQGIEELPLSLSCFVLNKEMDREMQYRLSFLPNFSPELRSNTDDDPYGSLCMCALQAVQQLHTDSKYMSLIESLLSNERAVSLTQVKSVLEFSLWGPSDVCLGSTIRERELGLQRWLDLQRATVLHGLVCTRVQLTVYEECHLLFLVRSNARMMCDASLLIESSNMKAHCISK